MKKPPKNTPSSTPATQTLSRAGVPFTVHTFETERDTEHANVSYGLAAAQALGVEHDRVFKTLMVALHGATNPAAVAVVPVTRQLNLKELASSVSAKRAELLDPATAERMTGYVVGGISPLGQRRSLQTVIDQSALDWDTIFVSAGRRGADIEMSPKDLIRLLDATAAPISDRSWS